MRSVHWKLERSVSAPKCQLSPANQNLIKPFLEPFERNLGQKSYIKRPFQPRVKPISAQGPNQPYCILLTETSQFLGLKQIFLMLSWDMDDYPIVSSPYTILKPEYISKTISEAEKNCYVNSSFQNNKNEIIRFKFPVGLIKEEMLFWSLLFRNQPFCLSGLTKYASLMAFCYHHCLCRHYEITLTSDCKNALWVPSVFVFFRKLKGRIVDVKSFWYI